MSCRSSPLVALLASAGSRTALSWDGRPFFAFLNYYDAHDPYELRPGRLHRFGVEPSDNYQRILTQHWGELQKKTLPPKDVAVAAAAYDDCIADLDEQLGILVDELDRRGVLERTWLIIASDHGESFGEHTAVFCHGASLYETELHVPLLIIPPGGSATIQAVKTRSVCATWRRRSSTWLVSRPGRHFPENLSHGFGRGLGRRRRSSPHRPYRRSPRWSCTTGASPITGAFPNDSLHWGVIAPRPSMLRQSWSFFRRHLSKLPSAEASSRPTMIETTGASSNMRKA